MNPASQAVDAVIENITIMRLEDPTKLGRLVFCFPRIRMQGAKHWGPSSLFVAAACAVARDPSSAVTQPAPIKRIGPGHPMPSLIVRLAGIEAVEYHVSKKNMERLLFVGCVVIQSDHKGFFVRIPYNSPLYHGKPYQFE